MSSSRIFGFAELWSQGEHCQRVSSKLVVELEAPLDLAVPPALHWRISHILDALSLPIACLMADPAVLATSERRPAPVTDAAEPRSHAIGEEPRDGPSGAGSILDHAPATMPHLPQQQFEGGLLPAQPVPELLQGSSPRLTPRSPVRSGSSSRAGSSCNLAKAGSSGVFAAGSPARAAPWVKGNGGAGGNGNGAGHAAGGNGNGNGRTGSAPLPQSPMRSPRPQEAVVQNAEEQPVLPTQALPVRGPVNITHNYTAAQAVMEAGAQSPEVRRRLPSRHISFGSASPVSTCTCWKDLPTGLIGISLGDVILRYAVLRRNLLTQSTLATSRRMVGSHETDSLSSTTWSCVCVVLIR